MTPPAPQGSAERREQLRANLEDVRTRIARAAQRSGRSPDDVTLVVITKTWPAADVVTLVGLGVADVGENRDQEAAPKAAEVAALLQQGTGRPPRWHFVGQLQTNKAASVVRYCSVVQSVDRPRLVTALSRAAVHADREISCLVQVGLDHSPGRGGADSDTVRSLADAVAQADALRLEGVMAVAPLHADPDRAFADLALVAARVRADHPEATVISAGMTDDLEPAIAHGATHVRVGRAVLGARPAFR